MDNSSIKNEKSEKLIINKLNKFKKYLNNDQKILFEIDYSPRKLKRFMSNFNSKFGISYDSGNSASKGYSINDEKIYFNKVYNIHIKDRYLNGKTVPLGKGNCDFKSLFLLLKSIKYKRNIILQTARSKNNHVKEIIKNIKFIKKLNEKYFIMRRKWFLGNYLGSEFSKDKYFVINFARQKINIKIKIFI